MDSANKLPKKPKFFDKRLAFLVGIQLFCALMIVTFIKAKPSSHHSLDSQAFKEVGNHLHAAGVLEEAISNYEKFVNFSASSPKKIAPVAFSIAQMHESMSRWEKALSWYYMAKTLDKNSQYSEKANLKIVSLLERLGKVTASKRALEQSTSLDKPQKVPKGSVLLAVVGKKNIYAHDLDQKIDLLPDHMKGQFNSRPKKRQLLEQMVADEVLAQKALRLQIDQKAAVRKKLEELKKSLLVQEVLKAELGHQNELDPTDVQNYYNANQEKYAQKERARVSYIKVKSKATAQTVISSLKKGKKFESLVRAHSLDEESKKRNGRLPLAVQKDTPFMGFKAEIANKILKTKVKKWAGPYLHNGHYFVFFIDSKRAAQNPSFKEVKAKVEYDYQMEKNQKKYRAMIEQAIKGDNVSIHAERIL